MGLRAFPPPDSTAAAPSQQSPPRRRRNPPEKNTKKTKKPPSSSSWAHFKNLLTCKQVGGVRDPATSKNGVVSGSATYSKLGSSCGSMCSFKDVAHGNTSRVVHRAETNSPTGSLSQEARLLSRRGSSSKAGSAGSVSSRSVTSCGSARSVATTQTVSYRGVPLGMKLSGCYECRMIVDPSRYPIIPRATVCACSQCGEIFPKIESLEHHQAARHAVSELGPEDSGRNIVEIIFKSSWMKKDNPICKVERILKVHNTPRTIQRFEDCRDAVKLRANSNAKKNPRCAADGNELLRFYCTTLSCALGARGSSSLCASVPACGVCTIIRHGFQGSKGGVRTTASSGRAHDSLACTEGKRVMLVCRVIAGRVHHTATETAADTADGATGAAFYDSVAGGCAAGAYSNLEELVVFNSRAILPCFVVIYKTLNLSN